MAPPARVARRDSIRGTPRLEEAFPCRTPPLPPPPSRIDPAAALAEPATDILRAGRRTLGAFFAPRAVALIGATDKPGSVGRTILTNLIASPFGGTVYPVNPKRRSVVGIATVPSVAAITEPVDLAVIVTPPPGIPAIIEECGRAGIGAAIVISAGFKEVGPEGAELERQTVEAARRYGMRLIGPNCLGVMSPVTGLNATFAAAMAPRGRVAFVSQSGALVTAVLDWALREKVGFSSIVSLGSMADVGWGDLIDHLGNDRETDAIVMYMETVGDARVVHLGGPRGGPDQAHHRDEAGPHGGGGQGGGLPHRVAGGLG